jgi:glycosyltransferase involved in cell wall biosynthesis
MRALLPRARSASYRVGVRLLRPLNAALARVRRDIKYPNSVLHVSDMVHIAYYTTRILRRHGWKADYLAVGNSPTWNKSDFVRPGRGRLALLRELWLFWSVVAKYEVVHLHFMRTMTATAWELEYLKRMGRKIVVHYRGCEIRDRARNMALHPEVNLCQVCDYNATICTSPENLRRRELARRYADHVLVTTPDMKDFAPEAEHFPFFAPEDLPPPGDRRAAGRGGRFRIVHATNHPGLEGSADIRAVIDRLKARGHAIDFVFLRGVSHEAVLDAHRDADLAIGKMKMGYYANAQIESMALGVPTVTYVRPEFITSELRESGFVLCHLHDLEATLERLLTHPEELAAKRAQARASILRLHDNDALAQRLIRLYRSL